MGRVRKLDGRPAAWRLDWESRRHHAFLAGASGCGKSTAMLRLVEDDLAAHRSVVVVDPHGDLADAVLALAGEDRTTRIDPRDPLTAPLDLLDRRADRAAAHLLSAVAEAWPQNFAGPVFSRAMSLALRVLAARPLIHAPTLAEVERYVVDHEWREQVIGAILGEGRLRAEANRESRTWRNEPRDDHSLVNWLAGKLTPLTHGPAAPLFDRAADRTLEDELSGSRVVVTTLPLGLLSSDTVSLVGRMFLTRLISALASQGNRPEAERRPVSIVIDEAHLFAGPALGALFAQARKFHGALTLATQSPSRLSAHLSTVLTNTQTMLLGRLPTAEAVVLRDRVGDATLAVLPTLPRHHLVAVEEDHRPELPPLVLTPVAVPDLPGREKIEARRRTALMPRLAAWLVAVHDRRVEGAALDARVEAFDAKEIGLELDWLTEALP